MEIYLTIRLRTQRKVFDATDAKLLRALAADGRLSIAALSRLVALSAPSVAERLKRLEDAGVIQGYTVKIDQHALGLSVAAWLRIRPIPGQLRKVAEILKAVPEIIECDRITGDDCFLARAVATSVADLERVIDEFIPYATTNTSIIQSSPVEPRLPPLAPKDR